MIVRGCSRSCGAVQPRLLSERDMISFGEPVKLSARRPRSEAKKLTIMASEERHNHQLQEEPSRPHLPTQWQCALLILRLIRAREEEAERKGLKRNVSRARISQNTIRKLSGRSQIPPDFLLEVQEYLLAAGWALFCIGPTHYAIIKLESVLGWSRISSRRIAEELKLVPRGDFPWKEHENLLTSQLNDNSAAGDRQTEGEDEEAES